MEKILVTIYKNTVNFCKLCLCEHAKGFAGEAELCRAELRALARASPFMWGQSERQGKSPQRTTCPRESNSKTAIRPLKSTPNKISILLLSYADGGNFLSKKFHKSSRTQNSPITSKLNLLTVKLANAQTMTVFVVISLTSYSQILRLR